MIYVAAGGRGSRIRAEFAELGMPDIPKHLLPTTPDGEETLLARAVADVASVGHEPCVLANEENRSEIVQALRHQTANIVTHTNGSALGPFSFTQFLSPGETGFSVAGDVYIDQPDWRGFMAAHDERRRPVSFLVGQRHVPIGGAVFELSVNGDMISGFSRALIEQDDAVRNIGMYAFTMTHDVHDILTHEADDLPERQDAIASLLIESGLVGAYMHRGNFFNINTLADYEELLEYTSRVM